MKKTRLIEDRLPAFKKLATPCRLCAHRCEVDRGAGETGLCRSSERVSVYSYAPHHGEEPPISGTHGSGTIFFTHCNMRCVYCQNYAFSQESDFEEMKLEELASRMVELQKLGCHNINLVSPTHYAYQIIKALRIAMDMSLDIPIVYNTGGYDAPELIDLLDGIIDIYLPDMRYADEEMGKKFSGAYSYVQNNRRIIKKMYAQVDNLILDEKCIALKGLIIRLLIIPNNISGTVRTLKFLKENISKDVYLSIMSQYYPAYHAQDFPEISRRINESEYKTVVQTVKKLGFTNGWVQGYLAESDRYLGTNIRSGKWKL